VKLSPAALLVLSLLAGCGDSPRPPSNALPDAGAPVVGPAGGTVTSADGRATLVVPPGALAVPLPLTLRPATSVPLDPHATSRSGYALDPRDASFTAPATLTLQYDPALGPSGTDERELRLHAVDGGIWEQVAQASIDLVGHEASAPVRSGGTYGVVWIGPQSDCTDPMDHQFDFWLGRWNFSAPGVFPGTNDITAEGRGCLLEEHFQDTAGVRGRSTSLFGRRDGQWHQTYVDSLGGRLVLVGSFEGTRMVLYQSSSDRFLWEATSASVVRYWEEISTDNGATWRVAFDSSYARGP
jgi:hypothetical protein